METNASGLDDQESSLRNSGDYSSNLLSIFSLVFCFTEIKGTLIVREVQPERRGASWRERDLRIEPGAGRRQDQGTWLPTFQE